MYKRQIIIIIPQYILLASTNQMAWWLSELEAAYGYCVYQPLWGKVNNTLIHYNTFESAVQEESCFTAAYALWTSTVDWKARVSTHYCGTGCCHPSHYRSLSWSNGWEQVFHEPNRILKMNADWMQSKLECQNFSAPAEAEWERWRSQHSLNVRSATMLMTFYHNILSPTLVSISLLEKKYKAQGMCRVIFSLLCSSSNRKLVIIT